MGLASFKLFSIGCVGRRAFARRSRECSTSRVIHRPTCSRSARVGDCHRHWQRHAGLQEVSSLLQLSRRERQKSRSACWSGTFRQLHLSHRGTGFTLRLSGLHSWLDSARVQCLATCGRSFDGLGNLSFHGSCVAQVRFKGMRK